MEARDAEAAGLRESVAALGSRLKKIAIEVRGSSIPVASEREVALVEHVL